VLHGGYVEQVRHREDPCVAGSIVVHPAQQAHADRVGAQGARCVNIEPDFALLDNEALLRGALRDGAMTHVSAGHPALRALAYALSSRDAASSLALLDAAREVMALAVASPALRERVRPRWLGPLIDSLEADLAHTPCAQQLARVAGVHVSHAMRAFKQHTGETVGNYLRRRRLEHADQRVLAGDALAHVAVQAGFFDQAHFTRTYRQHFGLTPGQRRRQFGR
jgi:AraC family transcriptional regulator